MRDVIRFLLGSNPRELRDVSPTLTVLEYLRTVEYLCGTKEGCAEGDCGACTVVLGEPDGDAIRYRAVNACILFVPALDGKQLLTVEHLRGAGRRAASGAAGDGGPARQPMRLLHAGLRHVAVRALSRGRRRRIAPRSTRRWPAICAAAPATARSSMPHLDACAGAGCRSVRRAPPPTPRRNLRALDTERDAGAAPRGQHAISRRARSPHWRRSLLRHPDAMLLAGGTDVGLLVTKQHRKPGDDRGTRRGRRNWPASAAVGDALRIGAGATYEDALAALEPLYPDFGLLLRRLGSRQIRNRGTIGGNIGNASPIGDAPPVLIALDATLVLRRGDGTPLAAAGRFLPRLSHAPRWRRANSSSASTCRCHSQAGNSAATRWRNASTRTSRRCAAHSASRSWTAACATSASASAAWRRPRSAPARPSKS